MTPKLISYRKIFAILGIYLFLSFAGCVMVIFRPYFSGQIAYRFLIWNLWLAWIPAAASVAVHFFYTSRKGIARALLLFAGGIGWLVFYPNAPYLITDFIHLSSMEFYFTHNTSSIPFAVWYDFIMFSLFILTGFLLGFVSLYLMQTLIAHRFGKLTGWTFVVFTLFLSSFGIYLGRFVRLNSWDIVSNPIGLLGSMIESLNKYTLAFTITFGLFLLLIYIALYFLTLLGERK